MTYREALDEIAAQNGGVLRPVDVVEAARDENNVLHSAFEWDDSIAGEKYRQWQARQLIARQIQKIDTPSGEKTIRVYLCTDETADNPGYFKTEQVQRDIALLESVKQRAARELESFERKYETLTELSEVFAAARKFRDSL